MADPTPQPARPAIVIDPYYEKHAVHRAYIREFFVDVLGSLVPGFLFTVIAALLLAWASVFFWRSVGDLFGQDQFAMNFVSWLEALRFELFGLVLVASYVMGSLFFRQDPKEPDKRSASYSADHMSEDDRKKAAVRGWPEADVQFPYLFLYEYLADRGLTHLARLVPWRGSDPATHSHRTKMFINQLKIRLQFMVPDKCGDLIRNEAHVRMTSSVWYAAAALRKISVIAGIITLVGIALMASHRQLRWTELVGLLFTSGGLYYAAYKAQRAIQRFFHYQRVREVVYVLETAYFAQEQRIRIFLGSAPAEDPATFLAAEPPGVTEQTDTQDGPGAANA